MRLALILITGILLVGCADGRFTEGMTCMPDGSIVLYQYKNTSGNYDGAKADPKYCK